MPQMMPLNWNLFFLFFNLIFLIFLIMSFFNYTPIITSKINNLKYDNKSILNFWPLN
uniref:ATP synthase F0 subunit 8 n=1 Tax=Brachycentrus kozlovi TaxID=2566358 RepID=A0A9E8LNP5_9NEOP|nr:ATP synthase F0 subunit 8 [Brachycentrus kozlovi]UZZ43808.1 ATP synthase F0 subunit 8 [Brachycentrus kozlovi]